RGSSIRVAAPGGGTYEVPFAFGGTGVPGNPQQGSIFTELTPLTTYKMTFPDGRQEYYEHFIGPDPGSEGPGRTFLSRIVDPQGKEPLIEYDSRYPTQIHQSVDATAPPPEFHYDYPGEPYLVTSIEDPFGRTATFAYAPAAGKVRLQSIEDP